MDVKELSNIKAETTIDAMREYFSTWGIPEKIVSDNGLTFTAEKFQNFLKCNGITHILTAPYHPSSNGAAENAVKYFKNKFKILKTKVSRREALSKYLYAVRSTIHSTTGVTPAKLHIGRKLRTRLDLLRPSIKERVGSEQAKQRQYYRGNRTIDFKKDDMVIARAYSGNKWVNATIIEQISPVTYVVQTVYNQKWKRHVDQLKPRIGPSVNVEFPNDSLNSPSVESDALNEANSSIEESSITLNDNASSDNVKYSNKSQVVVEPCRVRRNLV